MIKALFNLAGTVVWGMLVILCTLAVIVGIPFIVSWAVISLACLILHAVFAWFYVWVLTLALVVLIAMSIE